MDTITKPSNSTKFFSTQIKRSSDILGDHRDGNTNKQSNSSLKLHHVNKIRKLSQISHCSSSEHYLHRSTGGKRHTSPNYRSEKVLPIDSKTDQPYSRCNGKLKRKLSKSRSPSPFAAKKRPIEKVPYYRDEVREYDRLKRLYSNNRKDVKSHSRTSIHRNRGDLQTKRHFYSQTQQTSPPRDYRYHRDHCYSPYYNIRKSRNHNSHSRSRSRSAHRSYAHPISHERIKRKYVRSTSATLVSTPAPQIITIPVPVPTEYAYPYSSWPPSNSPSANWSGPHNLPPVIRPPPHFAHYPIIPIIRQPPPLHPPYGAVTYNRFRLNRPQNNSSCYSHFFGRACRPYGP